MPAQTLAMTAIAASSTSGTASTKLAAEGKATARVPLCFVVDGDSSVRHFLSLILHGAGIDTEEFADGHMLLAALSRRNPDIIFLNIALESAEAIETVVALGKGGYGGYLQLMSSRGSAVLGHVKSIGDQQRLQMLPSLKKPFETGAVLKILQDLKFGEPPSVAARIDLQEALDNGWLEFWYQPKIDLRRKQLIGAEAFARVRHPQDGVLMPGAFMPGADEASLIKVSEQALTETLKASLYFSKLGVNLKMAVNIPVSAVVKISLADIVQMYRPQFEKWPGLIIDLIEEEIITDLKLAAELADAHAPLNLQLAIDHFGRGVSALARLKQLPFAELKLDRTFVNDCATDKVNAPLCKTVIDLAHNFGSLAVAIGIEKASDAIALVAMGCDYGQGFLLGQPMPQERFISLLRQRTGAKAPASAPGEAGAAPERQHA